MNPDIVRKLGIHLSKGVDSEAAVVYLFAQLRKLLDRDDPKHRYVALWMYCHWALHVDLNKPKTTSRFLKRVDRWVTNSIAYLTPSGPCGYLEEHRLFRDLIYLDMLRRQLRRVLKSYGLPTDLCDDEKSWNGFLEAYSGVIEDGTLSILPNRKDDLAAVSQVTFSKGAVLSSDHHVPFVIQWDIQLKDGRTIKAELKTVPTKSGKMTARGLVVINGRVTPPVENGAGETTPS